MLNRFGSILLPALLALLMGCSPGGDTATPKPSEGETPAATLTQGRTSAAPIIIIGEARPPLKKGESLSSLMQGDAVVAGRVLKVALPYGPRPGYLGWTPGACPFPADHPKFVACSRTPSPEEMLRPPGRDFTIYEVEVDGVLQGSGPNIGDKIFVGDGGGVWEGKVYQLEGDPPLKIGGLYLLNLDRDELISKLTDSAAYFTSVAFSQFMVDGDGKLQPVDPVWASMPAVQALTGRAPEDALAAVQAALATDAP